MVKGFKRKERAALKEKYKNNLNSNVYKLKIINLGYTGIDEKCLE